MKLKVIPKERITSTGKGNSGPTLEDRLGNIKKKNQEEDLPYFTIQSLYKIYFYHILVMGSK